VIEKIDRPVACGVAIVVTHRQRVLFGKRVTKSTTGYEWQLPGGWINSDETPQRAAERELLEETGLAVYSPRFVAITSNRFAADNHSISLFFEGECADAGALILAESDKCIAWEWKLWNEVGDNLYLPLSLLRKTDYRPFSGRDGGTYVSL
jgi:ADP-ribose pyrophosphatase YjhB (NUDIX family)